ncbi:hypothetical protein, partial [Mesorhizobium sp. B2-4-16]|uniref:hypothetical protein n=1 Tax=Mesorhizobium sp. B2-4-16 TaxID=2589933 RepID=UPI001AEDED69
MTRFMESVLASKSGKTVNWQGEIVSGAVSCRTECRWWLAETPIAVVIHGRSKERSDARRP